MKTKKPRLKCLPGKPLAPEEARADDLSLDGLMSAISGRVRNGQYADQLEANLLLSIIEDRTDDTDRLLNVIDRRNQLGLTLVSHEPESPPRSS